MNLHSPTSKVKVSLAERSYDIEISTGKFESTVSRLNESLGDMTHAIIIMDQAVADPWGKSITRQCKALNIKSHPVQVASGEQTKSFAHLQAIWTWMLNSETDRKSVVLALGGGVVGDLAGFAAASYARGIRFAQIPTTLLAMVDSSVGGKTGINLPTAKNMVGAFWQPSQVYIDTDVLSTLPDQSYLSGLGEVVKYGVIGNAKFFTWLEKNAEKLVQRDPEALRYAVQESCESKAAIVGQDERETTGQRATLNYGHTFAHAIEATAGYGTLLHGEAVAIGMQMAARLAIKMGRCESTLLDRQTALLQACKLPVTYSQTSPDELVKAMAKDKKVAHGKLRFILPQRLGKVDLVGDVPQDLVLEAIEDSM